MGTAHSSAYRIVQLMNVSAARNTVPRSMAGGPGWTGVEHVDVYSLPELDLATVSGMVISGMCDQIFLSRHQDLLTDFVNQGGRMLINGHVGIAFLPQLPLWRKLVYASPDDLRITRVQAHPIWEGVDLDDLLYRTGVPGAHSRERLAEIGVAGFYGRGYSLSLPADAVVLNGIGQLQAPIDYSFRIGKGEVVVHSGLDLEAFPATTHTTLGLLASNASAWLGGRHE